MNELLLKRLERAVKRLVKAELVERIKNVVYIPTRGCMNLAATVNVLLYDRPAKESRL